MNRCALLTLGLLLCGLSVCVGQRGQEPGAGPALPVVQQAAPNEACRRIFANIERGIGLGLVEAFAAHFAGEVSVTLPGGGSGTYSARQAGLVLEGFFKTRRLGGFRFTTFGESEANP